MKLTYRGVTYEYNPPQVETVEGGVTGKYRGLDWRFRNLKKPPVLQPTVNLKYRGVTYNHRPTSPTASEAASVQPNWMVAQSVAEQARSLMLNRDRSLKKRQQSMLSRLASEVGLEVNPSIHYNQV
ncbi:MAG: DUF4278 domain-containing protein [Actinomycetota bacterium]